LKNISQKYFSKIFCEVEKINTKLKTYHGSKKENNQESCKESCKETSQESQERQKINFSLLKKALPLPPGSGFKI